MGLRNDTTQLTNPTYHNSRPCRHWTGLDTKNAYSWRDLDDTKGALHSNRQHGVLRHGTPKMQQQQHSRAHEQHGCSAASATGRQHPSPLRTPAAPPRCQIPTVGTSLASGSPPDTSGAQQREVVCRPGARHPSLQQQGPSLAQLLQGGDAVQDMGVR